MVRLCVDTDTGERRAMKIINKAQLKKQRISHNKSAYSQIENEVAIMKKICHPNVVRLFEIIDDPNSKKLFLIMEYVPGGTVLDRIRDQGPIPSALCWKYFRELVAGLEFCHECANIVHRDIKPDNLLLGEDDTIRIADFGVSYVIANGSDASKATIGSRAYMAPEVCRGCLYKGKQIDIWAAGVTLFHMVTGHLPFLGDTQAALFKAIKDQP